MLEFLAAIPAIGAIVKLVSSAITGIVTLTKFAFWKLQINKLLRRKNKIQDAETPEDWTKLLNG